MLAGQILAGFDSYARDHVCDDIYGEVTFDVMTAFCWSDPQMLGILGQRFGTDLGAVIREDEASFMDRDANRFFLVEDRETIGDTEELADPDDAHRVNILVKCPEGEGVEVYSEQFQEEELPRLRSAAGAAASCVYGTLQSTDNHPALFDLVTELVLETGEADRPALRDWALQTERSGARVVIVGVNRHESAMDQGADRAVPRDD